MKREGASPVVAAGAADSVASGVSSGVSSGAGVASSVSVTAGTEAGASSPSLSDPEITTAPIRRIPRSTAKRIFDEFWLFAAGFDPPAAGLEAAGRGVAAAGVVETLTRDEELEEPIEGTGGITT
jgi:hypothetical protein